MCIPLFQYLKKRIALKNRFLHIAYQNSVLESCFESFVISDLLHMYIEKHMAKYIQLCQMVWLEI